MYIDWCSVEYVRMSRFVSCSESGAIYKRPSDSYVFFEQSQVDKREFLNNLASYSRNSEIDICSSNLRR